MTDQQIAQIVSDVLKDRVPEAKFLRAEASSDKDFDGEPIIRITAYYVNRPNERPDALTSAVHDIRSALISCGEERFVFLSNDIANEQGLDEEIE